MNNREVLSYNQLMGAELFTCQGAMELDIDKLEDFANHPFKLYSGERLENMKKSIRELGVISPIIVRNINHKYEILSGHNRVNAAKAIGIKSIPAIVKEHISDEEAMLIVTESNLMQRTFTDMSYSERAAVINVHYQSLKRQGKRTDLIKELEEITSRQVGEKLNRSDNETNLFSARTISRYIRIDGMTEGLKEKLDAGRLKFTVAETLSYLETEHQQMVNQVLDICTDVKVTMKAAEMLKEYASQQMTMDEEFIYNVLVNSKTGSQRKEKIVIDESLISKYFSKQQSKSEIIDYIDKALEFYDRYLREA